MFERFIQNTRKPESTFLGKVMLWSMNWGHNPTAIWGLNHLDLRDKRYLLDIGCGGGKNISNLLTRAPKARVCGIDYSSACVDKSRKRNRKAIGDNRVEVLEASVESIPYEDETFDGITSFESVYFWPNLPQNLLEVFRVLKPGGIFLICNETSHPEGNEKWMEMLDMPIYTGQQLRSHLSEAGFIKIELYEHEKRGWLCVTAEKGCD